MDIALHQQILVLDCYQHTLTVIRSLSRAGYKVTLGVTEDNLNRGFVHVSRHVSSTWLHPDIIDDRAGFDTALLGFLNANPQLKLIYPVGENSVRRLASIRADILPGVLVAMPDNKVVETCLNKPTACQVAKKCQIPVPGTRTVYSTEELREAVKELGFPLIVRATDSRSLLLDRKCVFVRNGSDLEALANNWPGTQREFMVQNEIKGRRHNCDIVAENGRIRLYCESEILRTDRADYTGISVFDRSIPPNPIHREYCQRFVAELNYTGLGLIQFLRDADTGISHFLEANPRTAATTGLAVHCGVDLPAAAVAVHVGNFSEFDTSYAINQSQNWFHGDLLGLRWAMKNREVSLRQSVAWLASAFTCFVRADCHVTFSWKDPMPTMKLYRNLLIRLLTGDKRDRS